MSELKRRGRALRVQNRFCCMFRSIFLREYIIRVIPVLRVRSAVSDGASAPIVLGSKVHRTQTPL